MGNTAKVVNAIMVSAAILFGVYVYVNRDPGLPDHFKDDYYWGPKPWKVGDEVPKDDASIKKFTIKVEDSVLTDLKSRLKQSRLPSTLPGVNFEYGFNSNYLKKVIDYWVNKYDWRKEEAALNKYPQFTTQIEGLTVHYYHIKPSVKAVDTKPMIMVHGWPGSVVEFQKIIPLLTTDSDLNFELIIPSLPGYGWSEASHKPGLNVIHVGRILSKLMTRLGHQHFVFHGGDWGSLIGRVTCVLYPKRIIGFHNTMPTSKITLYTLIKLSVASVCPSCVYDNPELDVDKFHPVMDKLYNLITETGYMHIQATKPDTVATGLSDSPAGLAAYILEKFAVWTNIDNVKKPDGGLTDRFNLNELLTNVMVYWVTNSISTSQRLYKESLNYYTLHELNLERVALSEDIPVGLGVPANDLIRFPKALLKEVYYNVTTYTDLKSVGHFTCFEDPKLLAADIKFFVQSIATKRLY